MRDETGDKPVPILEVSMLNQSSELKECNDVSTTNINEMEKVPRVSVIFISHKILLQNYENIYEKFLTIESENNYTYKIIIFVEFVRSRGQRRTRKCQIFQRRWILCEKRTE